MKEWGEVTFMKEWVKALDKTRILAPTDLKNLVSFPRYGRLKLELLCEEISHVKFGLCNKYRIYKGLNTSDTSICDGIIY